MSEHNLYAKIIIMKNWKVIFKWILFLPVGYLLFSLSQFFVFTGLSFLLFWIKGFSTFWLVILSLGFATPVFTITVFVFGGAAIGAFYLSPNRTTYWILAVAFLALGFRSVFQYCSVGAIPETATETIIQLPCWIYAVIYLLHAGIIIAIGSMKKEQDKLVKL